MENKIESLEISLIREFKSINNLSNFTKLEKFIISDQKQLERIHFEKDIPVILAGNSIHQDRRFIVNEWLRLDERLHYRMLDVSAWKIIFDAKYGIKFAKPEAHRAIDDIRGSIEELQYYLKKLKI